MGNITHRALAKRFHKGDKAHPNLWVYDWKTLSLTLNGGTLSFSYLNVPQWIPCHGTAVLMKVVKLLLF